ncbi:SAV0927 family protein [Ornithinibacillus halophilus]|uniref:DUF3055 domain-containing protein n=1 Tax=Ornithinibacillus halophilus TaxID=930117 RepID=A0A1M5JNR9_9BACI|nr:SAV0927 family protein [Ornithinibacillus halophilus]SHG42214.1 Protein of unknown function [Ornithinibacillus halophilus]
MGKHELIKDETIQREVRYISFMGRLHRYDLAIMDNSEDPTKKVVINLQNHHIAIIGSNDLSEKGNLAHSLLLSEMEADEVREVLQDIL